MTFENQERINNNKHVYLAAIAQTAMHGWHGAADASEDCSAKKIAEAIGIDPNYTYEYHDEVPYDVPDEVIEKVKGQAEKEREQISLIEAAIAALK